MKARIWEPLVITFLALGMLVLNVLPTIIHTSRLSANRGFMPIHNSLSDYPYYTSIISQGIDGQMKTVDRFTNESHSGAYIHVLYLAIGWVGRIFHYSDAHGLYFGARILFGILWMASIYIFIKKFIRTPFGRIAAFFFAVCGAGFPIISELRGTMVVTWPLNWWTEFNPILRVAFLPHYLLGHSLLVFSFLSFMTYLLKGIGKHLAFGILLSIGASIVHPPSYIMIAMLVPLYGILIKQVKRTLFAFPGICLGLIPIYYYNTLYLVFPWTLASSYERLSFEVPFVSYVLGLGPTLLLGIAGFIIKRKKKESWVFFLWFFVPTVCVQLIWYMVGMPIFTRIQISNMRFLQVGVFLPLAIGAGFLLEKIMSGTSRIGAITLCVGICVITFVGYPMSIKTEINRIYGAYEFQYPKREYVDAMKFVRILTKPEDIVLALPLTGQMIPSYSNRTVYVGNKSFYTKDLSRKMDEAWAFYKGIPLCTAFAFVKNNRITTVFYGFDEQKAGDAVMRYSFLKNAGTFGQTELFAVDGKYSGCE